MNDPQVAMTAVTEEMKERVEIWREGITMALYVSLSQLAVMTAMPSQETNSDFLSDRALVITVALTSVGLVFAHQVAFRMSSRLVAQGSKLEPVAPRLLRAQLLGGGLVTLLAVVPIAIFGAVAYKVSIGLLLAFVMVVGYLVARSAPRGRVRSLTYVMAVGVAVAAVLAVKSLVNH